VNDVMLSPEQKEAILKALSYGAPPSVACRLADVGFAYFESARITDQQFEAAVDKAVVGAVAAFCSSLTDRGRP